MAAGRWNERVDVPAGQRPKIGNGQAPGTVTGRGAAGAEAGLDAVGSVVAVAGFAAGIPISGPFVAATFVGSGAVFFCAGRGAGSSGADTAVPVPRASDRPAIVLFTPDVAGFTGDVRAAVFFTAGTPAARAGCTTRFVVARPVATFFVPPALPDAPLPTATLLSAGFFAGLFPAAGFFAGVFPAAGFLADVFPAMGVFAAVLAAANVFPVALRPTDFLEATFFDAAFFAAPFPATVFLVAGVRADAFDEADFPAPDLPPVVFFTARFPTAAPRSADTPPARARAAAFPDVLLPFAAFRAIADRSCQVNANARRRGVQSQDSAPPV